jgi:H+/gluconate symporter-like permease
MAAGHFVDKCASHHRFEIAIDQLSSGQRELYGLLIGTPSAPGIQEILRRIESRLSDIMLEREEERAKKKAQEANSESRFWHVFRTVMPFLLGLLALWLSVRLGLKP